MSSAVNYEDCETSKEIAESDARLALYVLFGIEEYFGKEDLIHAR